MPHQIGHTINSDDLSKRQPLHRDRTIDAGVSDTELFQAYTQGKASPAGALPPSEISKVAALLTEWVRGEEDALSDELGECRCASIKVHICYLCGTYY